MKKIGILLKIFSKKKFRDDFLSGNIYMNTIQYFRDYEDEHDGNVSDENEALHGWFQPGAFKLMIGVGDDMREINQDSLSSPMAIRLNAHNHANVFCMTQLHSHDVDMSNPLPGDIERLREYFTLPDDASKLGDYAVIINEPEVFLSKLIGRAQELYNEGQIAWYQSRAVSYYDEINESLSLENELEAPFYKQSKYSHQQEYRFLLINKLNINKPYVLDIGDIRHLCSEIKTNEFNGLIDIR